MVETHKILMGCKFDYNNRINSSIGKTIENYKVQIKRLERSYNKMLDKNDKNEIERMIISEGKIMLEIAKKSLRNIYENNYLSVLERSMNRSEICIGRADEGNLRKNNDIIEIGTTKAMCFDLVEEDLYRYIKRLQKKDINIDEEEMIRLFVHSSHLPMSSIKYLKSLCKYPKDFFRIWEKYLNNKKNKSIDEICKSLNNSIKYERKYQV